MREGRRKKGTTRATKEHEGISRAKGAVNLFLRVYGAPSAASALSLANGEVW